MSKRDPCSRVDTSLLGGDLVSRLTRVTYENGAYGMDPPTQDEVRCACRMGRAAALFILGEVEQLNGANNRRVMVIVRRLRQELEDASSGMVNTQEQTKTGMTNKAMERALNAHPPRALDVLKIGTMLEPGLYELSAFTDDMDYCDAERELWIWSIGKRRSDGKIFAATDSRFYAPSDEYECLWLR